MHAAIVEFDTLADTVRAAAEHDDLVAHGRIRLALFLVGRVQVGGGGSEFSRAGIDTLVDRAHVERAAQRAHRVLVGADQLGQARVGETLAFERAHARGIERGQTAGVDLCFRAHEILDLHEEPRIDTGQREHILARKACAERIGDIEHAIRAGFLELALQRRKTFRRRRIELARIEPILAGFESTQRFLQ